MVGTPVNVGAVFAIVKFVEVAVQVEFPVPSPDNPTQATVSLLSHPRVDKSNSGNDLNTEPFVTALL